MSIKNLASRYFVAAAGSAAISFVTLPLTTRILGPRDFGAVAIVGALVSVGSAFSTLGTSFLIYRYLPEANEPDSERLVSTLCWTGFAVAVTWGLLTSFGFASLRTSFPVFASIPRLGFSLAVVAMVISPFWAIAMDVLTLNKRATFFAGALIAQALTTAAVTLFCLYVVNLRTVSLFAGNLAGALVLLACAAFVLRGSMLPRLDRTWIGRLREMAATNAGAQASETGYTLAERFLVSRYAGLDGLGLFTHSQRYRDVVQLGVKAVVRGAFPVSLEEARDTSGKFVATRNTWSAMYVVITVTGTVVATTGDLILSLLTNDKFTSAYVFLGPWFIYLLVQNSARPQFATLFALGEGSVVARANLWSYAASILLLGALVPWFGTTGAVAAALLQIGLNRAAIAIASRRYRATPWQDSWVVLGAGLITAAMILKHVLEPNALASVLLALTWAGVTLAFGRQAIGPVIAGIFGGHTRPRASS